MSPERTRAACLDASAQEVHRARPIAAETFQAWRIISTNAGAAYPIDVTGADAASVVQHAASRCSHKDFLAIRRTDPTGQAHLSLYAIKRKSQPRYAYNAETKATERWHQLYPELLFSVPVSAFDPVEPWRWTPGCDPVGIDRNEVRQ